MTTTRRATRLIRNGMTIYDGYGQVWSEMPNADYGTNESKLHPMVCHDCHVAEYVNTKSGREAFALAHAGCPGLGLDELARSGTALATTALESDSQALEGLGEAMESGGRKIKQNGTTYLLAPDVVEAFEEVVRAGRQWKRSRGDYLSACVAFGDALITFKARIPHGSWMGLIQVADLGISDRRIRDYMALATAVRADARAIEGAQGVSEALDMLKAAREAAKPSLGPARQPEEVLANLLSVETPEPSPAPVAPRVVEADGYSFVATDELDGAAKMAESANLEKAPTRVRSATDMRDRPCLNCRQTRQRTSAYCRPCEAVLSPTAPIPSRQRQLLKENQKLRRKIAGLHWLLRNRAETPAQPAYEPPERIQRRRDKGWRRPEGKVVDCTTRSPLGNRHGTASAYRQLVIPTLSDDDLLQARFADYLMCWCGPEEECHVDDIIAELVRRYGP